jgi:hypothetical protein
VVDERLAVFGGVERTPQFSPHFDGDSFNSATCFFDLRMNQWDRRTSVTGNDDNDDEDDDDDDDDDDDEADERSYAILQRMGLLRFPVSRRRQRGTAAALPRSGAVLRRRRESTPCARRNPAYATLGRHMLVACGWDDQRGRTLDDTWALDVARARWRPLDRHRGGGLAGPGPRLEAHKAVVSGFDMYTFGGHSAPGAYPHAEMTVNCLSLGAQLPAEN